ncbi:hypothetical protein MA16_Dca024046 [Dendrobium catenatum]|uniref:Uncharacterized protein n=1 Tax=Dendrobium catenatum TaxID=906689 RepID=A0A2I0VG85_9ASPA|nr:hypothetical protein MA16_Dca024046 [Dendrobium catenatum]
MSVADPVAWDSWCYEVSSHLDIFSPLLIHRGRLFLKSMNIILKWTLFKIFNVVDLIFLIFVDARVVPLPEYRIEKILITVVVGDTYTCVHRGSMCLRSTHSCYPQVVCVCWQRTVISATSS